MKTLPGCFVIRSRQFRAHKFGIPEERDGGVRGSEAIVLSERLRDAAHRSAMEFFTSAPEATSEFYAWGDENYGVVSHSRDAGGARMSSRDPHRRSIGGDRAQLEVASTKTAGLHEEVRR